MNSLQLILLPFIGLLGISFFVCTHETNVISNLAASLISLVLTQTAILSFTHQGDMSYYNGLAA